MRVTSDLAQIRSRYERPWVAVVCSAGLAGWLGIWCDRPEQGLPGEHAWAGRHCALGCEPALVRGYGKPS
jgi:hypothetical protein